MSKRGARFSAKDLLSANDKRKLLIDSNSISAVVNKPFENYAAIVTQELKRLRSDKLTPNINSLRKDFDNNVHPLTSAKEFYESWH